MARRNRGRDKVDQGRGFFETSSPFETFSPGASSRPKTFTGLTDHQPIGKLTDHLSGPAVLGKMDPEQYDNPRGYPGLSMVTSGDQKAKVPFSNSKHSIAHHAEAQGSLARTGKP